MLMAFGCGGPSTSSVQPAVPVTAATFATPAPHSLLRQVPPETRGIFRLDVRAFRESPFFERLLAEPDASPEQVARVRSIAERVESIYLLLNEPAGQAELKPIVVLVETSYTLAEFGELSDELELGFESRTVEGRAVRERDGILFFEHGDFIAIGSQESLAFLSSDEVLADSVASSPGASRAFEALGDPSLAFFGAFSTNGTLAMDSDRAEVGSFVWCNVRVTLPSDDGTVRVRGAVRATGSSVALAEAFERNIRELGAERSQLDPQTAGMTPFEALEALRFRGAGNETLVEGEISQDAFFGVVRSVVGMVVFVIVFSTLSNLQGPVGAP